MSHTSNGAFTSACMEFTPGAGMWCLILFADDRARDSWAGKLRSAFRLLADSGLGGERSRGWGRSKPPQFQDVDVAQLIPAVQTEGAETGYWLLSLYSAGAADRVDWARGDYSVLTRSGRAEQTGALKQRSRMIEEGSVVFASEAPVGGTSNVAPDASAHPVYRWGIAAAFPVPVRPHGVKYRFIVAAPEPEPAAELEPEREPEPVEEPQPEPEPASEPAPEGEPEPVEEPQPEPPPVEEPEPEAPPVEEPPPAEEPDGEPNPEPPPGEEPADREEPLS
jgi:hypothetical protein